MPRAVPHTTARVALVAMMTLVIPPLGCKHKKEPVPTVQAGANEAALEDRQAASEKPVADSFPEPRAVLALEEGTGHFTINAILGESIPMTTVFDTGHVEGVLISEKSARLAGLTRKEDFEFGGIGSGAELKGYISNPGRFVLGGVTLKTEFIVVPDDSTLGRAMCDFDAIVGFSLIENFLVRVRSSSNTLELYKRDAPYSVSGTVLPIQFDADSKKLSTDITVWITETESRTVPIAIDTGAAGTPLILSGAGPDGFEVPSGAVAMEGGVGVQGTTALQVKRIHGINLGDIHLAAPMAAFDDVWPAHNLGYEILSRFDLLFDLQNRRMVLTPTADSYRPFEPMRRAGINWKDAFCGPNKVVSSVVAGSVADRAGVQAGDTLLRAGGTEARELERSPFRSVEPTTGTFRRGAKTFTVPLHSETLIP